MERKEKEPMENKKIELNAFLHVKKGQPSHDCPFQLEIKNRTNINVIIKDERVTKKV